MSPCRYLVSALVLSVGALLQLSANGQTEQRVGVPGVSPVAPKDLATTAESERKRKALRQKELRAKNDEIEAKSRRDAAEKVVIKAEAREAKADEKADKMRAHAEVFNKKAEREAGDGMNEGRVPELCAKHPDLPRCKGWAN